MSAPTLRIPESVADDPSDVADALEVASALWGKGQSEEAIRWLRRAVAAASETDDAVRAAGLAGAAADLEEAIKQPSAAPPAAPAPTESAAVAAPAEAKAEASAETNGAAPFAAPAPAAAAPTAMPTATPTSYVPAAAAPSIAPMVAAPASFAPAAAAPSIAPMAATPAVLPPPPVTAAPYAALHDSHEPQDAAEATLPDTPAAMSAYANGTASYAPRPSSVPAPRSTFAKPPVIHPTHSPTALPDLPARMRVSVKTSVRDAGLLFVRALADGEEAPPGTLEAYLVREAPEADGDANGEGKGTPEQGAS